jgi:catechol 2,3-dioxygenase-like lactoylglutathione lyase family enzyme
VATVNAVRSKAASPTATCSEAARKKEMSEQAAPLRPLEVTGRRRDMLRDKSSSAIVAVSDIGRAKKFYRDTLGLEIENDMGDVLTFRTGDTSLAVYRSEFAGTNKGNAVVWDAGGDIDAIVTDLKGKGVTFERYGDIGDYKDGIHHAGGMKLVWLKDPDGNILHINSM